MKLGVCTGFENLQAAADAGFTTAYDEAIDA